MARRRAWATGIGVTLLVVAVVVAVGLWQAGDRRYDDNVAGFARAPVGCDTTLAFDGSGEFVLYLETTGEVEGMSGDCDVAERYDRPADGLPNPEMTLRGPDGDPLTLDRTGGVDYDTGDFVGTAYRLVEIDSVGDHVLTVSPTPGEPFAVAVGRDPNSGVALLHWAAVATLIVGLIGAGVLLVLGGRRPAPPPPASVAWQPAYDAWPVSPPGFPVPPPTTGASGPAGPPRAAPPPWGPPRQ